MDNPYKVLSEVNPISADGYRQVPNDLWWALLKADISGAQFRIALTVYDKTEGYKEESAKISMTHFGELTGLARSAVANAIQQLEASHIILVQRGTGRAVNEYLFNKHYDTWSLPRQLPLMDSTETATSTENRPVASVEGSEKATSTENRPVASVEGSEKATSTETATSTENRPLAVPNSPTPEGEAKKVTSPQPTTSSVPERGAETVKIPLLNIPIKDTFITPSKGKKGKKTYGVGQNVYLTDEEYQKLIAEFGEAGTLERINNLSTYIGSKGKKYKSHYLTILHWETMHPKDLPPKKGFTAANKPPPGKIATQEELNKWNQ